MLTGGTRTSMDERLERLERDLRKVQGVESARVVGDEDPSEIHIVSSLTRTPKQVVRDVQSLAAARFDMPIDHRIVSVVQLDEEAAPAAIEAPENGRPILDRVVVASKGDTGWVRVVLRWPDGSVTEGAGAAGPSREARTRGATVALLQALEPALEPRGSAIDVQHAVIQRVGAEDLVVVRATFREGAQTTPVVAAAVVQDDVASAAVRALLQAVNRKLSSRA